MHVIDFIGTNDNKLPEFVLARYAPTYKPYVAYFIFIERKNRGINKDLLQIVQKRRPGVELNYRNTGKVGKPLKDGTGRYLYSKDKKRHSTLPLVLYGCKTWYLTLQYRKKLGGF
jgi:hypothetical protein